MNTNSNFKGGTNNGGRSLLQKVNLSLVLMRAYQRKTRLL